MKTASAKPAKIISDRGQWEPLFKREAKRVTPLSAYAICFGKITGKRPTIEYLHFPALDGVKEIAPKLIKSWEKDAKVIAEIKGMQIIGDYYSYQNGTEDPLAKDRPIGRIRVACVVGVQSSGRVVASLNYKEA